MPRREKICTLLFQKSRSSVLFPLNSSYNKSMKNKVFANASIVTFLSVAERALGFLYRIVLSRLIGAEGLGLYQVALSLFGFFITIGTGGIPITVSRMISKNKAENNSLGERRAVASGITLCLLLTLPAVLIFGVFGRNMTFLFSDDRSLNVFRILLIGLCFSAVYAVVRGYFWGNKEFLLPSILEIAEESVMVIAGILLLQNITSVADGAEKAAWAVVISYLFSFTASSLCFFFRGGRLSIPKNTLKPLFNATLPITSVRASSSLVNSAVAVLLPALLVQTGYSESDALTLFGVVSGMAVPILFIPSTIIGSISLVLVPELSEDFYRKNFKRLYKNIQRGLRVSLLVACALLPFFYALGADIGKLAFSNNLAGEIIVKSCPLLIPMSLTMISTGMLNSMGFEKQTFLYYFIGAAAMLLCILLLPSICGVYAYVIGMGVSFILNAVCNLIFLHKQYMHFQNKGGHVRVQSIFWALIVILPISILGQFCNAVFKNFFGELFAVFLTACIVGFATLLAYIFIGIIPKQSVLSFFKKRTQTDMRSKKYLKHKKI